MTIHDPFLTVAEAAEYTKCGPRTLRRRVAEGRLTAYRSGKMIRYKRSDLDQMFAPTTQWGGGAA